MRILIATVLGLVLGSFINVVAHRLPRRQSIVFPRSYCPDCGHRLHPVDLIPVLNFLLLRGHCRYCRRPIAWQYPVVELLSGGGFFLLAYQMPHWEHFLVGSVFFSFLLTASVIDLREQRLPDVLTLPLAAIGIILSFVLPQGISWTESLLGCLVGGGTILLITVLSRGGMGLGDMKFLAAIGTFLGPWEALYTLFGASLLGSVIGIGFLLMTKQDRKTPIPFGPFLAAAAFALFLY